MTEKNQNQPRLVPKAGDEDFVTFRVPESEIKNVIAFIQKLDMCHLADQVMQHLFQTLAMHFDFLLSE